MPPPKAPQPHLTAPHGPSASTDIAMHSGQMEPPPPLEAQCPGIECQQKSTPFTPWPAGTAYDFPFKPYFQQAIHAHQWIIWHLAENNFPLDKVFPLYVIEGSQHYTFPQARTSDKDMRHIEGGFGAYQTMKDGKSVIEPFMRYLKGRTCQYTPEAQKELAPLLKDIQQYQIDINNDERRTPKRSLIFRGTSERYRKEPRYLHAWDDAISSDQPDSAECEVYPGILIHLPGKDINTIFEQVGQLLKGCPLTRPYLTGVPTPPPASKEGQEDAENRNQVKRKTIDQETFDTMIKHYVTEGDHT